MTNGVNMNDLAEAGAIAFRPLSLSRWFNTAPHELAAGDHTTGLGPFVFSSGQLSARSCAPTPEETFRTFMNVQPPSFASREELNERERSDSRSNFSGEVAKSTSVHPFGARSDSGGFSRSLIEHADNAKAIT